VNIEGEFVIEKHSSSTSLIDEEALKGERSGTVRSNKTQVPAGTECPKCASHKIARSRAQGKDHLTTRLLARSPYRCLRCYHRFWLSESWLANPQRIRTWSAIAALAVLLIGWQVFSPSSAYRGVASEPTVSISGNSNDSDVNSEIVNTSSVAQEPSDGESSKVAVEPLTSVESIPAASAQGSADSSSSDAYDIVLADLNAQELVVPANPEDLGSAKQAAEQAEQSSQAYQTKLDDALEPNLDELLSIAKIEINFRIDQWRQAWSKGETERYLSFYSESFTPEENLARDTWEAQRRQRVYLGRRVDIETRNFDIEFGEELGEATVAFDQEYQSGSYRDEVRKQLVLKKEDDVWKILREHQLTP